MKKGVSNERDLDMTGTSFWLPMYVREDYRRDLLSEYRTTVDDEKREVHKKIIELCSRLVN